MTSRRRADELGHDLAMHLRAAYAHLRRRSNVACAPFGMTTDQFVLLTVLARHRNATQQELVRHCFSDSATMGAMLSLLEKKRMVIRAPHALDRRATNVRLSRRGRGLAERMRRGSEGLRVKLAGLFSQQELKRLIEFLDRIAGALQPPKRSSAGAAGNRQSLRPDQTHPRRRQPGEAKRRARSVSLTALKPKPSSQ